MCAGDDEQIRHLDIKVNGITAAGVNRILMTRGGITLAAWKTVSLTASRERLLQPSARIWNRFAWN